MQLSFGFLCTSPYAIQRMTINLSSIVRFGTAIFIYGIFSLYLYHPYFSFFKKTEYLFAICACLAAAGTYILSRRWVKSFSASFFAGAVYGFCPFILALGKFHPAASVLASAIPWLFCPAALLHKYHRKWTNSLLALLPFAAIPLAFQLAFKYRLFAVPAQAKLTLPELAAIFIPLVALKKALFPAAFYHVTIAPFIVGTSMLLAARRYGIMLIIIVSGILAFCNPILNISSIIWFTIPLVCASILVAEGITALTTAGFSDRKWILITATVMAVLAAGTYLLGLTCSELYFQASAMYLLAALAVGLIFFIVRAKLRITWLRLIILCTVLGIDIFFGARFIIDNVH